jgi:predicted XRE-type DNA-binding protein
MPTTRNNAPRPRTTRATGNVFADLGFPPLQAASLHLRAQLMAELIRVVRSRKLTQVSTARLFQVSQPRISDLMRAKVGKFSSDALVEMLAKAGMGVKVRAVGRRIVA